MSRSRTSGPLGPFCAALALACAFTACGGLPGSSGPVSGPDPATTRTRTALTISRGDYRHFPFAYDVSAAGAGAGGTAAAGGTLLSWSEHEDVVVSDPVDAVQLLGREPVRGPNMYLSGVADMGGGSLYGVSYITQRISPTQDRTFGWTSSDGGATWKPRLGVLTLMSEGMIRGAGWGGFLFHRRLHVMRDGSIQGTVYGNHASQPNWYSTLWVRSADRGATWHVVSAVAEGPAGDEGYAEPSSAVCPDGSIVVVMRTGPRTPLMIARSTDGARSWSRSVALPYVGWDPDLLLVGRTKLLLSHGTPDRGQGLPALAYLTASEDCGRTWGPERILDVQTASGYTALAHETGHLYLFTDAESERAIVGYPISP